MNITLKRVNQELTFDQLQIGDVFTTPGCEHLYVKVHLQCTTPPVMHPVRNSVCITGRVGYHFQADKAVIKATSLSVEV